MLIRKVTLMVGFAVGYVLGARAGTERYAQIERRARALLAERAGRRGSLAEGASDLAGTPGVDGTVPGGIGSVAGSATAAEPATRSIEEMTDLELELATAPELPGGPGMAVASGRRQQPGRASARRGSRPAGAGPNAR